MINQGTRVVVHRLAGVGHIVGLCPGQPIATFEDARMLREEARRLAVGGSDMSEPKIFDNEAKDGFIVGLDVKQSHLAAMGQAMELAQQLAAMRTA